MSSILHVIEAILKISLSFQLKGILNFKNILDTKSPAGERHIIKLDIMVASNLKMLKNCCTNIGKKHFKK